MSNLFKNSLHQATARTVLNTLGADIARAETAIFKGGDEAAQAFGTVESEAGLSDTQASMLNNRFAELVSAIGAMPAFAGLSEGAVESASRTALMFGEHGTTLQDAFARGTQVLGTIESVSAEKIRKSRDYTIALAGLLADNLDTVDEFVFPSISAGVNFGSVKITLDRYVIVGNTMHGEGLTDWDRTHLTDTNVVEDLLSDNDHVLYPVYTVENAAQFIDPALKPTETVKGSHGGTDFKTNMLSLTGDDVNLILLARAPSMSETGRLDILDRINDGVTVKNIAITFGAKAADGAESDVLSVVSLANVKSAQFFRMSGAKTANDRTALLNAVSVNVPLVPSNPNMAPLIDQGFASIKVELSLTLHLNLHNGTFSRQGAKAKIVGLYHSNPEIVGNQITDNASLINALAPTAKAVSIGASLSSATLRLNGSRLSTQSVDFEYQLTAQAPVTSERTLDESKATGVLELLQTGVKCRRRETALKALRNAFVSLQDQFGEGAEYESRETNMPGLYYMARPYIKEINIPIKRLLKEMDSQNRIPNLNSALMAVVSDRIHVAMQKTNLLYNKRTYLNNPKAGQKFGAVGDSVLASYMLVNGEERTLGGLKDSANEDLFTIRAMGVDLPSFEDTLYVFPRAGEEEATKVFGFGFTIEAPSIVVEADITRHDGSKTVLQVHPIYEHFVSTPLLLKFVFPGGRDYFAEASVDYVVDVTTA